jgi:hypothetical protein
MNVASLELCKELYELSGWQYDEAGSYIQDPEDEQNTFHTTDGDGGYFRTVCPAYDLGYLLRKLPMRVDFPEELKIGGGMSSPEYFVLCQHIDTMSHYWDAYYQHEDSDNWIEELSVQANTPEDAGCKLAIKLFELGIIK